MTEIKKLHKKWNQAADYRKAYEALGHEFDVAREFIEARQRVGLTQAQVAKRIKTTQSVIARLESGASLPSTRTLLRYAKATDSRLIIRLEPLRAR